MSFDKRPMPDVKSSADHALHGASSRLFQDVAESRLPNRQNDDRKQTIVDGKSLTIPPLDYGASSKGHALAETAHSLEGQKLWQHSKYARETVNGQYGCAASASVALEKAGYRFADSPTVGGLVGQLRRHGFTMHPAGEAKEGDVMVAYEAGRKWQDGGGHAHVGIVDGDGNVYNNSSRQSETWVPESPDVAFQAYGPRFVLRPPG